MAGTINGIGTSYCGAKAAINWRGGGMFSGDNADRDAMLCFVVFFVPIIPFQPLHLFDRAASGNGSTYRVMPLRWSLGLLMHVYFYALFSGMFFLGIILGVMFGFFYF